MIEVSVLKFPHATARWNLVASYLELRKRVFIEKIGWDLNTAAQIEYEQYDVTGIATYVIAHQGDQVLAGARLLRCDRQFGEQPNQYSYMIRDSFLRRIDLNPDICWEEPPLDDKAWELTRLVSIEQDAFLGRAVLDAANEFIKTEGGNRCLFLGWRAFMRMARMYGYNPRQLGDVVKDESGSYLAFEVPVI